MQLSNKPSLITRVHQRISVRCSTVPHDPPKGQFIPNELLNTAPSLMGVFQRSSYSDSILFCTSKKSCGYFGPVGTLGGGCSTPVSVRGSEASAVLIGLIETWLPEEWLLLVQQNGILEGVWIAVTRSHLEWGASEYLEWGASEVIHTVPGIVSLSVSNVPRNIRCISINTGMWMYLFNRISVNVSIYTGSVVLYRWKQAVRWYIQSPLKNTFANVWIHSHALINICVPQPIQSNGTYSFVCLWICQCLLAFHRQKRPYKADMMNMTNVLRIVWQFEKYWYKLSINTWTGVDIQLYHRLWTILAGNLNAITSPFQMNRWRRSVGELQARRQQVTECEQALAALSKVTACFQQMASSLGSNTDGSGLREELADIRAMAHRIYTGNLFQASEGMLSILDDSRFRLFHVCSDKHAS